MASWLGLCCAWFNWRSPERSRSRRGRRARAESRSLPEAASALNWSRVLSRAEPGRGFWPPGHAFMDSSRPARRARARAKGPEYKEEGAGCFPGRRTSASVALPARLRGALTFLAGQPGRPPPHALHFKLPSGPPKPGNSFLHLVGSDSARTETRGTPDPYKARSLRTRANRASKPEARKPTPGPKTMKACGPTQTLRPRNPLGAPPNDRYPGAAQRPHQLSAGSGPQCF